MSEILGTFSILFLPILITIILVYGIIKKSPIYDVFIEDIDPTTKKELLGL